MFKQSAQHVASYYAATFPGSIPLRSTLQETLQADVLIIGAGPVGMTLALALADSSLHVLLLDRQPAGSWLKDPRALALAHGSRQLLERLQSLVAGA